MKNKKNISKKIIIGMVILIFCFFSVPKTFALKKAIFPDEKSLQPIPLNAKPNFSGNINSTTGTYSTTGAKESEKNSGISASNALPQQNETKNKKNWKFYIILFLIGLFMFFIYKKIKQKIKPD